MIAQAVPFGKNVRAGVRAALSAGGQVPAKRTSAARALAGGARADECGSYLPAFANFAKRRLKESMRPSVSTNVFLPV